MTEQIEYIQSEVDSRRTEYETLTVQLDEYNKGIAIKNQKLKQAQTTMAGLIGTLTQMEKDEKIINEKIHQHNEKVKQYNTIIREQQQFDKKFQQQQQKLTTLRSTAREREQEIKQLTELESTAATQQQLDENLNRVSKVNEILNREI